MPPYSCFVVQYPADRLRTLKLKSRVPRDGSQEKAEENRRKQQQVLDERFRGHFMSVQDVDDTIRRTMAAERSKDRVDAVGGPWRGAESAARTRVLLRSHLRLPSLEHPNIQVSMKNDVESQRCCSHNPIQPLEQPLSVHTQIAFALGMAIALSSGHPDDDGFNKTSRWKPQVRSGRTGGREERNTCRNGHGRWQKVAVMEH